MQNRKLNNSQRKALVKLVKNAYQRKIERQKKLHQDAVAQVTKEVKAELGVAKIDEELKCLEDRRKELEARKECLGFSKYNDNPIPGSEAKRQIDQGAKAEKDRISELVKEMDKAICAIWMSDEWHEIRMIVDEIMDA